MRKEKKVGGVKTLKRRRHRKIVKSGFNRKKYGKGKRKKKTMRLSKRKRMQMIVSRLVVAGRNRRSAGGRRGM